MFYWLRRSRSTLVLAGISLQIQPPHVGYLLSPPREASAIQAKHSILMTLICPEFRHRFRLAAYDKVRLHSALKLTVNAVRHLKSNQKYYAN